MENNQGKISQEKLNAMLKMASGKLGVSPDKLKTMLSDPKSANQLLDKIGVKNGNSKSQVSTESLERMINNNPKAKKMLNDLLGDHKNG